MTECTHRHSQARVRRTDTGKDMMGHGKDDELDDYGTAGGPGTIYVQTVAGVAET